MKRTLNQYPALLSYFKSHPDGEKPGRVKRILDRLDKPFTQLTLLFLQYVLPLLNDFNKVFQADGSKIGFLVPEMDRLLRKFLGKFVQLLHIRGKNLREVEYHERQKQHDDEMLAVGMEARAFISENDELTPAELGNFFKEVRNFYRSATKKMLDKFPFEDKTLIDLQVLLPSARENLTYEPIVRLAAKFAPQADQESLKDEWEDFVMMEDRQLPLLTPDGEAKQIDKSWAEILELKTSFGEVRFPQLQQVMPALLCLPHSNADSERVFSMVRKIHTENRTRLAPETLTAFLQVKLNSDSCCHEMKVTSAMINKARTCTMAYNQEHC